MRKYIFSLIFISLGIFLLFINFYQNNKIEYPETIFVKNAKVFDKAFNSLIEEVRGNFSLIKNKYSDPSTVKNSSDNEKFFIKLLQNNPELLSVSYIQDDYKIHIYKSKNSIVIGTDSTSELDIVKWQRFRGDKFISSWEESFEVEFIASAWYKDLRKNKNRVHWIFDIKTQNNNQLIPDNNLFYSGYSYINGTANCVILLSFSRMQLLESFDIYNNYDRVNLLVETDAGKKMNLGSGITQTFKDIDKQSNDYSFKDSLIKETMFHYDRFDKQDSGIFNFAYNEKNYWNSFKKYNNDYGIKYYLLSVPNSEIIKKSGINSYNTIEFPSGILLLIIGLSTLFINKSRFYHILQRKIPPLKTLLMEDENRYLEFKSSLRWDYRQEKVNPALEQVIFKTMAAFGNTDGGILLIGVDDDKNILGLEKDFSTLKKNDADYFEIHLRNLIHTLMGVKYVSKYVRMNFETIDSKVVCKIKILKADEPLFLQTKDKNGKSEEKFYVRSGNSSQEIKSIADINDYINTRWK